MKRPKQLCKDDIKHINAFLEQLWSEDGLAESTLNAYRQDLSNFAVYLASLGRNLDTAHHEDLAAFQGSRTVAIRTLARQQSTLRRYYAMQTSKGVHAEDPSRLLERPKINRSVPFAISESQIEALLNAPNVTQPLGLRDRAMLELMYASGLRVSELVCLPMQALNTRQGVVRITGKGGKDRLVPVGEVALAWIADYLVKVRPMLAKVHHSTILFLSNRGTCMSRQMFWVLIKRYALKANMPAHRISPHTLRHAFATHLLNHHADLRTLQILMGHSSLSTTQIYTLVAREDLKRLHAKHHPRG